MYQPYERDRSHESRDRSRDKRTHGRSPSQDETAHDRRERARASRTDRSRAKRVKFEGNDDIRVFRKQDEPTAKGLAEEDIFKIKAEIEKEIAKSYDFNWEHYKHRDALLESNSMKEQKQREKALSEKLMAARELIAYSYPQRLAKLQSIIEAGCESLEKDAHTSRIHDILGCYYTHANQIPNEPSFEILNTQPAPQCKIIKFDNDIFPDEPTTVRKTQEKEKQLKGILKMPNAERVERSTSQQRQVDPQLIFLLKDFKANPHLYTPERTQQLLKPYRESGELDYLMKNKEVLTALVNSAPSAPSIQPKPQVPMGGQYQEGMGSMGRQYKDSVQRSGSTQPNTGMGMNMGMGNQPHHFVPKAEKFRTVPCKYYHSPQGCSKVDNCTFIHDERFTGVPVPPGATSTNAQQQARSYPPSGPSMVNYYSPTVPSTNPNTNPSLNPSPNPNFYNPSMGYTPPPYPGYYNAPTNGGYQGSYQMGKSASQYSQGPGNPPQQQGYGGQGYVNQTQGYNSSQNPGYTSPQGQGYGGQQGQYNSQATSQPYGNPNYQYYIGNNSNK